MNCLKCNAPDGECHCNQPLKDGFISKLLEKCECVTRCGDDERVEEGKRMCSYPVPKPQCRHCGRDVG